jgi:methionyl-tRNA formyltransferase
MRIILIGRTRNLLNTAKLLIINGHKVVGVITSKAPKEYKINQTDFKNFANELKIPFLESAKINENNFFKTFKKNTPEIGVSVNYSSIISSKIVNFFPYGILNAHGGDLPRYRGNACQAWAIINGEKKIGLCIHKMIGGELDSGDIISRNFIRINSNTRIGLVYEKMEKIIPALFLESINKLSSNKNYFLEKQSEEMNKSLRCYPRIEEDSRINWHKTNIEILRLINASSEPYDGAFSFFRKRKIRFLRAKLVKDIEKWIGVPGQVSKIHKNGTIDILTGKGKINVSLIEINGLKTKPIFFIKSIRTRFNNENSLF